MTRNDAELLREFVSRQDNASFRELVDRHLPLVYHAARRSLDNDVHLAQDVAQQVFIALAKKAHVLLAHRSLVGWLYQASRLEAAQMVRTAARRRDREKNANAMNLTSESLDAEALAPLIDELITELGETDRDAVLLRFFEAKSFSEIGEMLQISADAARMRVDRALEKMQPMLARRGVNSTAAAVALTMAAPTIWAVPAGLPATISETAIMAGANVSSVATIFMTTSKLKLIALGVLFTGGATVLVVQNQSKTRLETALVEAKQARAEAESRALSSEAKLKSLVAERAASATARAVEGDNPVRSSIAAAHPTPAKSSPALFSTMTPINSLGDRGRATPREAFATQLWAARGGDIQLEAKALVLSQRGRAEYDTLIAKVPENIRKQYSTPEELVAYALAGSPRPISNAQVLDEKEVDANTVTLRASWEHEGSSESVTNNLVFHRADDGWKLIIGPSGVDRALAYLSGTTVPAIQTPEQAHH